MKTLLDSLFLLLVIGLGFLDFTKNIGLVQFAGYVQATLGTDKRLHFLTGIIITLFLFRVLYRAYDFKFLTTLNLGVFIAIIILCIDEFSQLLFPTRLFSIYDIFAGTLGILTVYLILFVYQWSLKVQIRGVRQNT